VTRGLLGTHALGRFLVQAERQILEFARTDHRRVVRVIALDVFNYVLMAAEVWVVLRAVGSASSFATALTIETFTRVVSIVFAPIPGTLGALEASHLAVATAVGLAPAGRRAGDHAARTRAVLGGCRVRDLPEEGAPSRARRRDGAVSRGPIHSLRSLGARGGFADDAGCGLPIAERVLRHAMHEGVSRIVAWAPRSADDLRSVANRIGRGLPPLVIATTDAEWMEAVNSDYRPGSSFRIVGPGSIPKPALSVQRREDVHVAELAIRRSIFKPTDGVLARFNRRISLPISLVLIRTPITANQISVAIVALGFWAAWLFSRGDVRGKPAGGCCVAGGEHTRRLRR
jgi:hypothetical protein